MGRVTHRLCTKIIAIWLLIALAVALATAVVAVGFAVHFGLYRGITSYYETGVCRSITEGYAYSAVEDYKFETDLFYMGEEYRNVGITIRNKVGTTLLTTYTPSSVGAVYVIPVDEYEVVCQVADPITIQDGYYLTYRLFQWIQPVSRQLPAAAAGIFLAFLGILFFLLCAVGHRYGKDGICFNLQDRIPLDLYLATMAAIVLSAAAVALDLTPQFLDSLQEAVIWLCVCVLLFFLPVLATILTCATRLKAGKWWRNTLIWRAAMLIFRICRWLYGIGKQIALSLPLLVKTLAVLIGFELLNVILAFQLHHDGMAAFFWFFLHALLIAVICGVSLQLQRLKAAGERLAKGNLETKVDLRQLHLDFRQHGENLNSLSEGMSIALDQRMRSERMKTELITNVSHDIKTPLTSILNYVDLLQKEHTPQQQVEYLAVLKRQAMRLKKMTEDLMEASKASTGNLPVLLSPTNLSELISQAVGEYTEKLTAGRLEPVILLPPEEIPVLADGKLLWRVLDNLLNNVCKYAMPGTRVYLEVRQSGERTQVSVKNISREALNVEPEELTERFVRGDSSRHTEGSGLGLNIAKSLVELQGGEFVLRIDGDLFKAEIYLHHLHQS